MLNPTIDKHGTESAYLTGVFRESQRWESIPNRAEAMSLDMVQKLVDKANTLHPDSSSAAIADWFFWAVMLDSLCWNLGNHVPP